jgi:hypothetical protein
MVILLQHVQNFVAIKRPNAKEAFDNKLNSGTSPKWACGPSLITSNVIMDFLWLSAIHFAGIFYLTSARENKINHLQQNRPLKKYIGQ